MHSGIRIALHSVAIIYARETIAYLFIYIFIKGFERNKLESHARTHAHAHACMHTLANIQIQYYILQIKYMIPRSVLLVYVHTYEYTCTHERIM